MHLTLKLDNIALENSRRISSFFYVNYHKIACLIKLNSLMVHRNKKTSIRLQTSSHITGTHRTRHRLINQHPHNINRLVTLSE
ncbi:hypothetical protein DSUL_50450 [Desulfovibrionales bacterium]